MPNSRPVPIGPAADSRCQRRPIQAHRLRAATSTTIAAMVSQRRNRSKLSARSTRAAPNVSRTSIRGVGRSPGTVVGHRRVARDSRYPFRRRVDRGRHRGKAHRHVVTARVRMKNGKRATLRRRFKACARS